VVAVIAGRRAGGDPESEGARTTPSVVAITKTGDGWSASGEAGKR